jgi:hypothetical protein
LFRNTASKNHGRHQPCRGFLSCLAEKSLVLEGSAVLRKRFSQNRVNPCVRSPKVSFLFYGNQTGGNKDERTRKYSMNFRLPYGNAGRTISAAQTESVTVDKTEEKCYAFPRNKRKIAI